MAPSRLQKGTKAQLDTVESKLGQFSLGVNAEQALGGRGLRPNTINQSSNTVPHPGGPGIMSSCDIETYALANAGNILTQDISEDVILDRSGLPSNTNMTKLVSPTGPIPKANSATMAVAGLAEEGIGRVVRLELQGLLRPILETISKSQNQQERLGLELRNVVDAISSRIERQSCALEESSISLPSGDEIFGDFDKIIPAEFSKQKSTEKLEDLDQLQVPLEADQGLPYDQMLEPTLVYHQQWSWLGTILVEIKRRLKHERKRHLKYVVISINFWPSWPLLRRNCISLLLFIFTSDQLILSAQPFHRHVSNHSE